MSLFIDHIVCIFDVGSNKDFNESNSKNCIDANGFWLCVADGVHFSSCDIPFSEDLSVFNADYLRLTRQVAESCRNHDLPESMVIGTLALAGYDIDGAVGMYSGVFNNPFMICGRYRKRWFRTYLTVSFQFHHTQMDGAHAARFLDLLQAEIQRCGQTE